MNLYKCEKCNRTFVSATNEICDCKFCSEGNTVKKIDLNLMKPGVALILEKPSRVKELTNQELITDHFRMHQIYGSLKRLGRREKDQPKGIGVEEVVRAHSLIVTEMEQRKMNHNNRVGLDRDTSKLRNKNIKNLDWGDITLVENIVSVVGSALYKNNPNDVDVIYKFKDLNIEEKIKEIIKQKEGLNTHIIKGESHGEYMPKYDLILKERKPEVKINKVIDYRKLFMPLQYKEKTLNTDKFVIEPCLNGRRLMIYRKDENVEIYLGNGTRLRDKKLEERVNMIIEPEDFIIDTLQLKNGILVIQDILAKDNCNLLDDPLLSRKTFIWKMKIPKQAGIAFIRFKYCKGTEELNKEITQYKTKKSSCILKPAFSKYEHNAGWIKLSYEEPIKLDLGCGQRKKKGYLGIDIVGYPCVDIKHDCSNGIPLEDNSCSIVRMNHSAEHFADPKFLMEEVYRVLKSEGIVVMTVPEASTYGAQKYPDHKSFWTENDINYFVDESLIKKHEINCHFKLLKTFKKEFYTNEIKRVHLSWILQKSTHIDKAEASCDIHQHEEDIKEIKKTKKVLIRKYGTSAGAVAAWDSRGRGTQTPKTEPKVGYSDDTPEKIKNYTSEILSKIPNEYQTDINSIKIMNSFKFTAQLGQKANGCFESTTNTLFLNQNQPRMSYQITIGHEIGHSVWNNPKYFELKTKFTKYSKTYTGRKFTSYSGSNVDEHFAETFGAYFANPVALDMVEPSAYSFFKGNLK